MSKKQLEKLVVGIVTHKSCLVLLEQTLGSLQMALTHLASTEIILNSRIVILDNSEDSEYLEKLRVTLEASQLRGFDIELLIERNQGFGAAHNKIVDSYDADLYLALNPDVDFHCTSLGGAINAMIKYGTDLVVPRIQDKKGNELHLHIHAASPLYILLRAFAPKWLREIFINYLTKIENVAVDTVVQPGSRVLFSGCCMLFRRSSLIGVNGFDEKYFLYFEDYDLSLRALEDGTAMVPADFSIIHFGGSASKKSWMHKFQFVKSSLRFYKKLYITGFPN
ncbi:glycosyltransferase family 2 protein [Microbulbifer agarilyticus]|uniref:glycosyltransferase family 2 protein n=1 Tax=Microbulbifer agarilyticus TaxID=260552 RepID=UPI001CD1D598|nr:hypothetical protein [Microbulbifer agarilyticus]MCA0893712.1 hypothetical protein [Microbulbifer agarilyticus]